MGAQAVLENQAQQALDFLEAARSWFATHVIGGAVTDGDSTQASGANGALNFDADVGVVAEITVNGEFYGPLAAATDVDSDAGATVLWGATSGVSVVFSLVLDADDGSPGYVALPGVVAATGSEVALTDDEITEELGHALWVRVSDITIDRTADTTLAFTANDAARPQVTGFGAFSRNETELRTA